MTKAKGHVGIVLDNQGFDFVTCQVEFGTWKTRCEKPFEYFIPKLSA